MILALDTSAVSTIQRGNSELQHLVRSADRIIIPVTVIGELCAGYAFGNRGNENLRFLSEFLNSGVEVVDIDEKIAREYGSLVAILKKLGTPISINDVWIAAITKQAGAILVTLDSDFAKIPGFDFILLKP
jgi:predicted nucleic acid-binding protein